MLYGIEARALREHPPAENPPDLAIQSDFIDFDEGIGLRFFGPGARIADARRHLESAELDRLIDVNVKGDDAAGDLVDAGEFRDGIGHTLDLGAGAGSSCTGWSRLD